MVYESMDTIGKREREREQMQNLLRNEEQYMHLKLPIFLKESRYICEFLTS